jgi:hypothetical protein
VGGEQVEGREKAEGADDCGGLSPLQRFWPTGANLPARRPDPEPLETHDQAVIIVGTAIWAIAFVVLLAMHGRLADEGRGWWPWTALAGVGLGLWGMNVVHRRAARRARGSRRRAE